jgi:hypothetical protein
MMEIFGFWISDFGCLELGFNGIFFGLNKIDFREFLGLILKIP